MTNNALFYLVFISQIILISYYYPKQILARVSYVFKNYPSEEYPKLYNKAPGYFELGARIYKVFNQIILTLGLMLLCVIGYWDFFDNVNPDANISQAIPFAFWVLQMVPMVLMEITGFAYFKIMRESNKRTKRSAQLVPRRLFDFAIISNVACILFFFYLDGLSFNLANDTFVIILTLLASNIVYGLIIWFNLNGTKINPLQATEDRLKQTTTTINSKLDGLPDHIV